MTKEEKAKYITNHRNWDGCKYEVLIQYSEEEIDDIFDMIDDPEDWE